MDSSWIRYIGFCSSWFLGNPFSLTFMGDKNPMRTLGDYSKPSHEGYRNTIELLEGNNVVPLRFDTIRLVQNRCSFHGLWSEDRNQHLKDFLKLVDSLDLDDANRERTLVSTTLSTSWKILSKLLLIMHPRIPMKREIASLVGLAGDPWDQQVRSQLIGKDLASGLLVYELPLSSLRKKYRLSLKNDMPPRDNNNDKEFNQMNRIDDDLFTCEVEIAEVTNIPCDFKKEDDSEQKMSHESDDDMEYDPSNVEFTKWLASKKFNYKTMDHYTMKALWIYWARGDGEVSII
ncbi:hypothetical protein Tco_0736291 [Tanacetum coccineum]